MTLDTETLPLPSAAGLALRRCSVELRCFVREPVSMVFAFAYPVAMLVVFVAAFGANGPMAVGPAGAEVSYAQYFLPGMVATGIVLLTFQSVALRLVADRDGGVLARLRASGLPPVSFFGGMALSLLVLAAGQLALLLTVALAAYRVPIPPPAAWGTFAWVTLLGMVCGTLCGVAFSVVPRSARSALGIVVPVALLPQFISGVFFTPFTALPAWMQQAAALLPLKWLTQGYRAAFLPGWMASAEPAGSFELAAVATVLALWALGAGLVAVRTFRWTRADGK